MLSFFKDIKTFSHLFTIKTSSHLFRHFLVNKKANLRSDFSPAGLVRGAKGVVLRRDFFANCLEGEARKWCINRFWVLKNTFFTCGNSTSNFVLLSAFTVRLLFEGYTCALIMLSYSFSNPSKVTNGFSFWTPLVLSMN